MKNAADHKRAFENAKNAPASNSPTGSTSSPSNDNSQRLMATSEITSRLIASRPSKLAVQRLNSFDKNGREVLPMSERETPNGWKVSQVERLIDLPRRDIQRSCYSGAGGVGILEPTNGSWGKRLYGIPDIAKLMLVRLYKDQGCSLPEIKQLIGDQDCDVDNDLRFWRFRLDEQRSELVLRINRIDALLAALSPDKAQQNMQLHQLVVQWIGADGLDALEKLLEASRHNNPSPIQIECLRSIMNTPGLDLAIDLLKGPGSYDSSTETIYSHPELQP